MNGNDLKDGKICFDCEYLKLTCCMNSMEKVRKKLKKYFLLCLHVICQIKAKTVYF